MADEKKSTMNLDENVASALAYVLTWVTGIIFFFMEKENKTVRFHAMQSILTFLPLTIIGWALGWLGAPSVSYGGVGMYGTGVNYNPGIPALMWISWLVYLVMVILWLVLMFKAYQGEKFKVPIVGDIAENQIK